MKTDAGFFDSSGAKRIPKLTTKAQADRKRRPRMHWRAFRVSRGMPRDRIGHDANFGTHGQRRTSGIQTSGRAFFKSASANAIFLMACQARGGKGASAYSTRASIECDATVLIAERGAPLSGGPRSRFERTPLQYPRCPAHIEALEPGAL